MSIHIALTPIKSGSSRKLLWRGKNLTAHAHDVVTAYLNGAYQSGTKSLEEILAPIWYGWCINGMTDGEVDDLFDHELREVRGERRRPEVVP